MHDHDSRLGLGSAVRVVRMLLEPYLVTLFHPLHRVGSNEISLSSALRLDEKNRMGLWSYLSLKQKHLGSTRAR